MWASALRPDKALLDRKFQQQSLLRWRIEGFSHSLKNRSFSSRPKPLFQGKVYAECEVGINMKTISSIPIYIHDPWETGMGVQLELWTLIV